MDPITDIFNRIRNAQMVKKENISMPFSKVKFEIVKILKKQGFVSDLKKRGRGVKKNLIIDLKYTEGKEPALSHFKRISKPGQRIYRKANEIRPVRSGYGICLVSTSQGLMIGKEARKKKLGGEVLVEVW